MAGGSFSAGAAVCTLASLFYFAKFDLDTVQHEGQCGKQKVLNFTESVEYDETCV